jgi:hypothetical protein
MTVAQCRAARRKLIKAYRPKGRFLADAAKVAKALKGKGGK